jgi:hypothetical protein
MSTVTMTARTFPPVLVHQTPPRFRPGDLVVIDERRPQVCTVKDGEINGLIRLCVAACPETHLLVTSSEVQHLSVWLWRKLKEQH